MNTQKDKIVFRALNPKTQQPVRLCPLPSLSNGGKHYTGQGSTGFYENLSQHEKDDMAYVITPETYVQIHDGKVLNLENPIDNDNWKWMQKHPYVVMDRRKATSSRDARFYIENKEAEAKELISKDKLITDAKTAMYNASSEMLNVVAKAFGHPSPEGFSSEEIYRFLIDIIQDTPQAVIDSFSPEKRAETNVRSLFTDLQRYKIIIKSRGSYYFGGEHGIHLGRSEEELVDFLLDDDNKSTVDAMTAQLNEKLIIEVNG